VVRYDDAQRAAIIRRGFDQDRPELPSSARLIDVLNGGWWARRTAEAEWRDVRPIADEMVQMCRRIAAHG
jgi:hypothetical protein